MYFHIEQSTQGGVALGANPSFPNQGQQYGHPDFPLFIDFIQLFWEDSREVFPGQLSDRVTPAYPGSSLGKMSRGHPIQIPKPPQFARTSLRLMICAPPWPSQTFPIPEVLLPWPPETLDGIASSVQHWVWGVPPQPTTETLQPQHKASSLHWDLVKALHIPNRFPVPLPGPTRRLGTAVHPIRWNNSERSIPDLKAQGGKNKSSISQGVFQSPECAWRWVRISLTSTVQPFTSFFLWPLSLN